MILTTALEYSRCCTDPAPQCHLDAYGADGFNFTLYFWVADVTLGRMVVKSDILRAIWQKFKAQGIVIPFPQTTSMCRMSYNPQNSLKTSSA